uniref:Uncharacterized protein LOC105852471 n=1 Tax=Cicer arietinum TaxID=3827 RepID=A0A1S3ECC9_CICAR|nr:uncharacterized protein LOC105852471 [Cicer arietinum]
MEYNTLYAQISISFGPFFSVTILHNLHALFGHFSFRSSRSHLFTTTTTHFLFLSLSLSSFSFYHSNPKKLLQFSFMAEEDSTLESPHSLKYKLKSSLCLSCCFSHHRVRPRIVRSSSLRTHNKSRSNDFPHLKEKCCNFISRIARRHRRHSADFHYDALSYSLNFEDDAADKKSVNDLRSFSARLPASPPSTVTPNSAKAEVATAEITAHS